MKLVKEEEKEWEERRGYYRKILYSRKELPGHSNKLQLMELKKGATVPRHYHKKTSEIFYPLQGKATFKINEKIVSLEPGKVLLCEAGEVHEVIDTPEDFIFLTFKLNKKDNDTVWLE